MGWIESLGEFYASYELILWILGIVIPFMISAIVPKIRRKIKKTFYRMMLKIQGNDIGINAVYLKNYLEPPIGKLTDDVFEKIKDEISNDRIEKVSIHPRFLKIRSNKLGMKLVISLEQEHLEIEDKEYQKIPYNITVEMDADIKGSTNIHNLDDFVVIAEKIHEIIRTKLFPNADLDQSYVVCTINNIQNEITKDFKKSFEFEENQITIKKNSITIISYDPHSLTKTLKKYAYA